MSAAETATQMLDAWMAGDRTAPERLMPLVYHELRRRAARFFSAERPDHTLQATALVHEAYLKLIDQERARWRDRAHFCSVAATIMRRILLEHARTHNRQKRGGSWEKIYLDEVRELGIEHTADLALIDDVLRDFAQRYPREAEVVELKFFGGLTEAEVAATLDVSPKTVSRDWSFARAWLRRSLRRADAKQ